jgi:hypothetical protein
MSELNWDKPSDKEINDKIKLAMIITISGLSDIIRTVKEYSYTQCEELLAEIDMTDEAACECAIISPELFKNEDIQYFAIQKELYEKARVMLVNRMIEIELEND